MAYQFCFDVRKIYGVLLPWLAGCLLLLLLLLYLFVGCYLSFSTTVFLRWRLSFSHSLYFTLYPASCLKLRVCCYSFVLYCWYIMGVLLFAFILWFCSVLFCLFFILMFSFYCCRYFNCCNFFSHMYSYTYIHTHIYIYTYTYTLTPLRDSAFIYDTMVFWKVCPWFTVIKTNFHIKYAKFLSDILRSTQFFSYLYFVSFCFQLIRRVFKKSFTFCR